MAFNHTLLDSLGFVLPAEKNAFRAQIPETFFKFAEASNPTLVPQTNGRNIEIAGSDLIAVFAVLRSRPPSHRWKGSTVKTAMSKLGMGKHKVQEILALFFKEGWIRHIDFPKIGGGFSGSTFEVRFRRLPRAEAGKKRRLRVEPGGKVRFFEGDGKTEVKDANYPLRFLTDDADPVCAYGKETDAEAWSPYARPSGMRPSGKRSSDVPSPDERPPGEEYKDHDYKDHELECPPLIPRSGTGEQKSSIPRGRSVAEPGNPEAPEVTSNSAPSVEDASPGFDAEALTAELVQLGKSAADSPAARTHYEKFLKDRVFPMLGDPPSPDRWTVPATRQWLASSLKAHILLAITSAEQWSVALGKSFGKRCGTYTDVDFRKILLSFDWKVRDRPTLSYLIQADTGRANMKGWESFKKPLLEKFKDTRLETEFGLSSLQCEPGKSDVDTAHSWMERAGARRSDFLVGAPQAHDLFEWLYFMWKSVPGAAGATPMQRVESVKKEHHEELVDLLVHSRTHLAAASAMFGEAEEIWGIDWQVVRDRHQLWVECLNQQAKLLNLEPVEPLFHLIDGPLQGEPSDGSEEQSGLPDLPSVSESHPQAQEPLPSVSPVKDLAAMFLDLLDPPSANVGAADPPMNKSPAKRTKEQLIAEARRFSGAVRPVVK